MFAGTRVELYQSSRCICPFSSAIIEHPSECLEVGKPPMKPRLLAKMNWECWAESEVPSVFLSLGESANAAASQRLATSIASSGDTCHGWNRSRSGRSRASCSRSGNPAQSSAAVCRAMATAASTVWRSAAGEKSEVLAWPRLTWGAMPNCTETPIPLSRLCSKVSIDPLRTVTDRPKPSETSHSHPDAPIALAWSRTVCANSRNCESL